MFIIVVSTVVSDLVVGLIVVVPVYTLITKYIVKTPTIHTSATMVIT